MGQSVLVDFPADRITLADEDNLFTSENVEGALTELSDEIDAERLPEGTEGQVLAVDAEGDPAWVAPVDLSFGASNNFYKILDAIPTDVAEIYEGMIVYEKTGKTLQVCTAVGEYEVDTLEVNNGAVGVTGNITIGLGGEVSVDIELDGGVAGVYTATITDGATAAGDITLTLRSVDYPVSVNTGDTAAQVAGKITAAFADKSVWIAVTNVDEVVTLAYEEPKLLTGAFAFDGGETGVTCIDGIVETVAGEARDTNEETAAKIREATYTGWTTGGTGNVVTFTRDAVGAVDAPTFTDTGETNMTLVGGAIARTNKGVDTAWAQLINSAI